MRSRGRAGSTAATSPSREEREVGFAGELRKQVKPSSLTLPARIGNMYTAARCTSALASLLHGEDPAELAGSRIGMLSYGSGCASEFFSGVVGPRAAEVIARAGIDSILERRVQIGVAEYERIMGLASDMPPEDDAPPNGFRFAGVVENRRTYTRGWPSGAV